MRVMLATQRGVAGACWVGLACLATPSGAQGDTLAAPFPATVVSAGPSAVAVTIYRAPGRDVATPLSADWLGGYALISEEREVSIPAGHAIVQFEGVAAGMLAESALVSGLPAQVREKNLDAQLLSPRNLYARAFGRPVILRRLHPGSGAVEEERAIIRSGADGAAVIQTHAGFELADCGGLRDSFAFEGVPPGLHSRPTLSVETQAEVGQKARIKLSYLAWGFDWQAHYVLNLKPDARGASMTSWLTLASGDDTGFHDAQASVVAGQPHFEEARPDRDDDQELRLSCAAGASPSLAVVPPPPPPPPAPMAAPMMDVMVTASRRMMKAEYAATAESLGDLHLYRIPVATTVAAHAQKQVALLTDRVVKLALVHTATVAAQEQGPAQMTVRLRNRREDGLGMALPGGLVSVVQPVSGAAVPAGEGRMTDKAEGETIDIAMGTAPTVQMVSTVSGSGKDQVRLAVTNANRWPVRFEGRLALDDGDAVASSSAALGRKDGLPLWTVSVPAHGRAVLTYRIRHRKPDAPMTLKPLRH